MGRLADLMESNKELLATIDAWDNGKKSPNLQPDLNTTPGSDDIPTQARHTKRH